MNNMYGNLWLFKIELKAGENSPKHTHTFNHIHQIVRGDAIMKMWDGDTLIFEEKMSDDTYLKVPAGITHQICAVTDYRGTCIHARRKKGETPDSDDFFYDINKSLIESVE